MLVHGTFRPAKSDKLLMELANPYILMEVCAALTILGSLMLKRRTRYSGSLQAVSRVAWSRDALLFDVSALSLWFPFFRTPQSNRLQELDYLYTYGLAIFVRLVYIKWACSPNNLPNWRLLSPM